MMLFRGLRDRHFLDALQLSRASTRLVGWLESTRLHEFLEIEKKAAQHLECDVHSMRTRFMPKTSELYMENCVPE